MSRRTRASVRKILLVSPYDEGEQVYARMLALELEEGGYAVCQSSSFPQSTAEIGLMLISTAFPQLGQAADFCAHQCIPLLRYGSAERGAELIRPFTPQELLNQIGVFSGSLTAVQPYRKTGCTGGSPVKGGAQRSSGRKGSGAAQQGLLLRKEEKFVSYNGTPIELTQREYALLAYLHEHRGEAVPRSRILHDVWQSDDETANTVDVYIRYLRRKLDERFDVRLIVTVRGKGYMLRRMP